MGLAVNALTNVWIPEQKWALQFVVDFSRRPPVIFFNHRTDAYLNIPAKFIEALTLCRLASGADLNIERDMAILQAQLEFIGEDGLTYCPSDTFAKQNEKGGFSEIWGEGRLLIAISMLAQVDDNPLWVEIGKKKDRPVIGSKSPKRQLPFLLERTFSARPKDTRRCR